MQPRILLFVDQPIICKAIADALRSEGYEVLDFISPSFCSLWSNQTCACPPEYVCADIIIADTNMSQMSGIDLIRCQAQKGCHALPQNKIIISGKTTMKDEPEIHALGSQFLRKPFQIDELLTLVGACRENISPGRKLVPREKLLATFHKQVSHVSI